jgi:hypothetical protein
MTFAGNNERLNLRNHESDNNLFSRLLSAGVEGGGGSKMIVNE